MVETFKTSDVTSDVLNFVNASGAPVTMAQIAKGVDATPEVIRHRVRKLFLEGKIAREGGKRGPSVRYSRKENDNG